MGKTNFIINSTFFNISIIYYYTRYYINKEGRLADWAFFGLYEDHLRQLLKGEI
jgi:hypothetical protein